MIERELEIARRHNYTTELIMFDIDNFKKVNDVYGHNIGDLVLKEAVKVVRANLRSYDIFGRMGGEEFIIFTKNPGREGLVSFAERLRETLEELQINSDKGTVRLTASFGISEIPPNGNFKDALNKADLAMYCSNNEGRNRVSMANSKSSED